MATVHLLREALYTLRAILLLFAAPLLRLYRLRYAGKPTVHIKPIPEAQPKPLEGYTDRPWYKTGDTVRFFIKCEIENAFAVVEYMQQPGQYIAVSDFKIKYQAQPMHAQVAQAGCKWQKTHEIQISPDFASGYYRVRLCNQLSETISYISFLVQASGKKNKIAIIAPVSTWVAYNPYGGQSLYHNELDRTNIYYASWCRPNPALQYNPLQNIHAIKVEANIFCWINKNFGADLYPDFELEMPAQFNTYRVVVLAYHNEYFSSEMYAGLQNLIQHHKLSVLALGANQVYWKICWDKLHTQIECRKDASLFSNNTSRGGTWRQTAAPESRWLNSRFTEPGTGTYAPYKVLQPDHWLFRNCTVTVGTLFGESGINSLPVSGDETDKTTWLSGIGTEVIARGLNRKETGSFTVYDPTNNAWDGDAGGEICVRELSDDQAILNTGSIQSGSGLGTDAVFTTIIANFLERYI